ncbi:MAG TPA: hypothetical protein VGQ51_00105, partial [Puia sp.]|nr:hypothetical protein [Puia sp.]
MGRSVLSASSARSDMTANARRYAWIAALLLTALGGRAQYALHILPVDRDSVFILKKLGLD